MKHTVHQVSMTVDLSSASDSSNRGLNSIASEAARHRQKLMQLRREFLNNTVNNEYQTPRALTPPLSQTTVKATVSESDHEGHDAFVHQSVSNPNGLALAAITAANVIRPNEILTCGVSSSNWLTDENMAHPTTTAWAMTSSSSNGRTVSTSCVGHANECKAATVSTLVGPGSNVHVDSVMRLHTHKSPPPYEHIFTNRSCVTLASDWSTPYNTTHRSAAGLVSSFSPIVSRVSPPSTSSSSPSSPQSPRQPVTYRSCSLTESSRLLMPYYSTRVQSNEWRSQSQQGQQALRTYPSTPDAGSISSGSRSHLTQSSGEPFEKPNVSPYQPSPVRHTDEIGSTWQIGERSPATGRMDDQLFKMRTTLKDFNAHLSQIDSTLGRMRSCGSLSQYLDSISDAEADLDEPEWNPRHTPSPPNALSRCQQLPSRVTDRSSSRSDAGKSFECDTGVVTAHRSCEPTGRHTATLSSSLGASLSTLSSSSVWSSRSPSINPATSIPNRPGTERYESDTHCGPAHIGPNVMGKLSVPQRPSPVWSGDRLNNRYEVKRTDGTRAAPIDTESWVRATTAVDPLRFADSTSSSPNYDPTRPPDPRLDEESRFGTTHAEQAPLYANWNRRNKRHQRVTKVAQTKPAHGVHSRAGNVFWASASQSNLGSDDQVTNGHFPSATTNRTAYSITPASPDEAWRAINQTGKPGSIASVRDRNGGSRPLQSYRSSSPSSGSSSSPSPCDSESHLSRSGSSSSRAGHSRSVDSLIGQLSRLLRTGREDKARHVIGRLLDAPRSRRKLDSVVATLTARSRVLDEQNRHGQGLNGDPYIASAVKTDAVNGQGYCNSPTGSLLRLANSLITTQTQRGLRKPTRGSLSSLQSLARPYDSEYVLSTPNLSEHTRARHTPTSLMTIGRASASSRTGSMTSLGRSTISRSRPHVLGYADEQPVPVMRPQPRPAAPCRPKGTILPTAQTLCQLDNRAIKVASEAPPASFTELVRALINDMTDDVHIIRSLFIWTVTVDRQPHEFDPVAPADSLVGMLRRIRTGQLSRNQLLHKLCRYAGVHCQFITGYSKGSAYRPGMPIRNNHLFYCAWLAVFVADGWRFVNADCAVPGNLELGSSASVRTSATGVAAASHSELHLVNPATCSLPTTEVCDEFYFLTDPEQHIFHSFPDHKAWQLLRKPISLERFVRLPLLRSAFFNANLALKKNYGDCLTTSNGQVSVKLLMSQFVGISCSLENCADHSLLRGLCLVEVLHTTDVVRVHVAPSQPGTYYLHIYVAPDWRVEDCRQLACSFQIQCAEHNYSRLVVTGRLPEVGFLGPTPAARTLGVSMCAERSPSAGRALFVHTSSEPLRIPFAIAPGLKICHQLKSFDRPGHQMVDCDSYALLQMRPLKSMVGANHHGPVVNAYYHVRMPIEGFYYLTIYASSNADSDTDHLECVYRLLIDVRKTPPCPSAVPAFPRQTFWWVHCRLIEPLCQRLTINRPYTFRLDAPLYDSVAVVINETDWYFLTAASPAGRWTGKVQVGEFLGQLSVFGRFAKGFGQPLVGASDSQTEQPHQQEAEDDAYVKLLDYLLVE